MKHNKKLVALILGTALSGSVTSTFAKDKEPSKSKAECNKEMKCGAGKCGSMDCEEQKKKKDSQKNQQKEKK